MAEQTKYPNERMVDRALAAEALASTIGSERDNAAGGTAKREGTPASHDQGYRSSAPQTVKPYVKPFSGPV